MGLFDQALKPSEEESLIINELIETIQASLTSDLLKEEFVEGNKDNRFYGHCYVAAEALYHLLKEYGIDGYESYIGRDENGYFHWWLQDHYGNILDPTKDQYLSKRLEPPYKNGRRHQFVPATHSKRAKITPSDRAKELIERVKNKIKERLGKTHGQETNDCPSNQKEEGNKQIKSIQDSSRAH